VSTLEEGRSLIDTDVVVFAKGSTGEASIAPHLKEKKMNKLIAVAYIGIITGYVWGLVGSSPEGSHDVFRWWLPFVICVMFSIPAYLGYRAGKDGE